MPEPTVAEANVTTVTPQGAVEPTIEKKDDHPGLSHLAQEDRDAIIELRQESASKRVKLKGVEEELNQLKADKVKQEDDKLKEQGKLQELLDKKEAELSKLSNVKDENDGFMKYFTEQLEIVTGELTDTQKGILEDSNMDIQKKLKWARQMIKEGSGQVQPPPDSVRPGGKAPTETFDIAEYSGPGGRTKLATLQKTNPTLFEAIVKEKSRQ